MHAGRERTSLGFSPPRSWFFRLKRFETKRRMRSGWGGAKGPHPPLCLQWRWGEGQRSSLLPPAPLLKRAAGTGHEFFFPPRWVVGCWGSCRGDKRGLSEDLFWGWVNCEPASQKEGEMSGEKCTAAMTEEEGELLSDSVLCKCYEIQEVFTLW